MASSGVTGYLKARQVDFRAAGLLLIAALPSAVFVAKTLGRLDKTSFGRQPVWGTLTAADLVVLSTFVAVVGSLAIYNLVRSRQGAGALPDATRVDWTPSRVAAACAMGGVLGGVSIDSKANQFI